MGEGLILAAEHPERVAGMVQIGPTMTLDEPLYGDYPFEDDPGTDEGWAGDTDMATILAGFRGWETKILDPAEVGALCARVRCPVLVIHGTEDEQVPPSVGAALAGALGGRLVLLEGSGHALHVRDPVKVNLLLRKFVESLGGRRT